MSVVSCRFPNSITATCCGLFGRVVRNKSVTCLQFPRLLGSYGETCVMDFKHHWTERSTIVDPAALYWDYFWPYSSFGLWPVGLNRHCMAKSHLHASSHTDQLHCQLAVAVYHTAALLTRILLRPTLHYFAQRFVVQQIHNKLWICCTCIMQMHMASRIVI